MYEVLTNDKVRASICSRLEQRSPTFRNSQTAT